MLKNDPLPWLQKLRIYPTRPIQCNSKGTYFLGHVANPSMYYNGSTTIGHDRRQYMRFLNSEPGFEEGHTQWTFVGFPPTKNNIRDLLLEDTLIILTRSSMNSTLNILDNRKSSHQKQILEYINKNVRLKGIYMSQAFFEWFTKCRYNYAIESTPFAVGDIINNLLPSIRVSKSHTAAPQVFRQKKIIFRDAVKISGMCAPIYRKIETCGSAINKLIEKGKCYRLSEEQGNSSKWIFQEQSKTLFNRCHQDCDICLLFELFLNSNYLRMDWVLQDSHERHIIKAIAGQILPGFRYACNGPSGDGKTVNGLSYAFHSIVLQKFDVQVIEPPPQLFVPLPADCKNRVAEFNKRHNQAVAAGMNRCLTSTCLTCPITGGSKHTILKLLNICYMRSVACTDKGPYIEVNTTKNLINAGSTIASYVDRFKDKFAKPLDVLHDPAKRHQWIVFGLGTTKDNKESSIRYLEDTLILLLTTQDNYIQVNSTLNFSFHFRSIILQLLNKESLYANLYSTNIFYKFIFNIKFTKD